ncbi:Cation diffusion facilitator family transporter [Hyella patelloides LEGE 07179]|uniref:Cation diffusion facilitator family transporter n=1 Tax=Hyella patelloides LEGE 07179 TaxID=945734 RepID=A0A563W4D8_9CYAN|nr:cation diffusion facilitator family transporter [Hyella patelloides]VEP18507.1 Cation diffusion facilitator family transporter [Hyella patelloides LEGE 07179]
MKDNRAKIRQVLGITLLLNLLVMILKAIVGFSTGSLSLQADALHSVTDSANNILGLVANNFSSPQPDREHPYGHQKFEALGALGIATFLGIACFEILQGAIERVFSGENHSIAVSSEELWILLVVLGINVFVAFYEREVGYKINSSILIADAKHTMSDIWVTVLVMAGLIGVWQATAWNLSQLNWIDVILAFPVAILVFRSGWEVLQDNLPWLVDKIAISPEAIYQIVMEVPGVINCHDIASRGVVGKQVFVEMHLIVNATDVAEAHKITEEVEIRLKATYSPIRVLIHVEPPDYQRDTITFGSPEHSAN